MSWRQSLSVVASRTLRPRDSAAAATVAITSSASKAGAVRTGRFMASITAWMRGTCEQRSSGGGGRWALYSG